MTFSLLSGKQALCPSCLLNPKHTVQGRPEPNLGVKMHTDLAGTSTWTQRFLLNGNFVSRDVKAEGPWTPFWSHWPRSQGTGLRPAPAPTEAGAAAVPQNAPLRAGARPSPHSPSHLCHSLTNNKTLASGSFFLCILTTAQEKLGRFIGAYF